MSPARPPNGRALAPAGSAPSPASPTAPPPGRDADPFAEACDRFLLRTRHARTGSPHTQRAYRADLADYATFLADNALDFAALPRPEAARYLAFLAARTGPRTVNRRISCLRSFYRFAIAVELAPSNPFFGLDLPSVDLKSETHKVWAPADIERALAFLRAHVRQAALAYQRRRAAWPGLFHATRRRAVFVLLVTTGLRRAELRRLTTTALRPTPDGFHLHTLGKGAKHRTVPLDRHAYPAVSDWLLARRRIPTRSDALFISEIGTPLNENTVYRICRWIGRRVDAPYPLHPHLCRRSLATHTLETSGNLRAVQELLGHESIATTQIYTHVDHRGLRRVVEGAALARSEHEHGPLLGGLAP